LTPGTDIEISARLEITRSLEGGESLLWTGVPRQGLFLRAADVLMIPFSLIWGGFAFFWEWGVLHSAAPFFFRLWGIPFVAAGVYIILGRFFADSYARSKTCYGLTDRRVLVRSGVFSRATNSLPLRTLNGITLRERADGTGTISFGTPNPFSSWYAGSSWPGMGRYQVPSFDQIPDVKRVHDQILEAQRKAR